MELLQIPSAVRSDISYFPKLLPLLRHFFVAGLMCLLSLRGPGGVRRTTVCPGNRAAGVTATAPRGQLALLLLPLSSRSCRPEDTLVPEWLQLKCSVLYLISSNYTEGRQVKGLNDGAHWSRIPALASQGPVFFCFFLIVEST